jgi:alkylation response protein AidB-like acyl-CoA dehydrogenase
MEEYRPPIEEIRFAMKHLARIDEIAKLPAYDSVDGDLIDNVLAEAGKFMSEVISPLNRVGDTEGAQLVDGRVVMPPGFREAYKKLCESGWTSIASDPDYGGSGLPFTINAAIYEMFASANMAFVLCPALADGVTHAVASHATEDLKATFLRPLVEGRWTGTMDLTEPEAGSDLGALRCQAIKQDDGSYSIKGNKIFITFGDHDLAENIIHLVLARTHDAPAGSRGISLFIVPKVRVNEDGKLGEDNGIRVLSVEHKLGIHASPTCVLSFGEDAPCLGYLVGEENSGLQHMFTMMNRERIVVGAQGFAVAQRAYQQSVEYACEREQGRAPGDELAPGQRSRIVQHPDVRRMLMTMRAQLEAMRGLLYETAAAVDIGSHHPDAEMRSARADELALITPIVKAWLTDLGAEITSLAMQVHGGVGYIEETGVAQHFRDARIAPIYEGTNGVQAMDLVTRKIAMDDGRVVQRRLEAMKKTVSALEASSPQLSSLADPLRAGIDALERTTAWLLDRRGNDVRAPAAGASPYLRLFGTVEGAHGLARGALAAQSEKPADWSPGFLSAKLTTARFYLEQLLPVAIGLVPAITAGAETLFEINAEDL